VTKKRETETEIPVNDRMIDAALEIANTRAEALREIKTLLSQGEDDRALSLMKKFFGLSAKQNAKDSQAAK
jgi:hypothetical protein